MNKRQEEILTCVVDHFIDSHQPMSSSMVLDRLSIQLSSATVRQVFSVLDQGGYLAKLHSSSGRVPTDKGYRVYVDRISDVGRAINLDDYVTDQSYFMKFRCFFDQFLLNLSKKIPYVCMVWMNERALSDIAMLKYVSISSQYGLVVLFHRVGIVSEHYIRFEMDVSGCDFHQLTQWLIGQIHDDKPIKIAQFTDVEAHFLQVVLQLLSRQSMLNATADHRVVKNVNRCLGLSDYSDKASVQQLLDVLDDNSALDRLMMDTVDPMALSVKIGQELNDPRLIHSSFISIPIVLDTVYVARLGILGPRRMDYVSIVQLLSSKETLAELIQV